MKAERMSNKPDCLAPRNPIAAPKEGATRVKGALSPPLHTCTWASPSEEVVSEAMQRAKAIHWALEQGHQTTARETALALAKDVLGLLLLRCRTVETLHVRRRIYSIMHSLGAAGAFEGSYVLALVATAKMADEAEIQALHSIPAGSLST